MPDADLIEARRCYDEMQRRVKNGHAEQSVRSTENRCCHVRPHGRNKLDTLPTPYGTQETKKCFWINARYIGEEIDRVERENSRWRRDADVQKNGDGVSDQVIRVAELFAGVGGFRLGLEGYVDKTDSELNMPAAGPFQTVWANQWEPPGTPARQFAANCYRKRFDDGTLLNDCLLYTSQASILVPCPTFFPTYPRFVIIGFRRRSLYCVRPFPMKIATVSGCDCAGTFW